MVYDDELEAPLKRDDDELKLEAPEKRLGFFKKLPSNICETFGAAGFGICMGIYLKAPVSPKTAALLLGGALVSLGVSLKGLHMAMKLEP